MSPPICRPVSRDGINNNKSSAAGRTERQHRKGFELFVLPQKSHVRKIFRGFRQESTTEVAFAADVGPFPKNGRTNVSCKRKVDKGGVNAAIPLMGYVLRTFSGAFPHWGFPEECGLKKSEAELHSEMSGSKRRFRSKEMRREMPKLGDHLLLLLLNRLDAKSCGSSEVKSKASFCGCNEVSETAGTSDIVLHAQFFCESGFLHACPIETSNLAQLLSVRKKKPGRRKQKTLGFARLQGEPLSLAPDNPHSEVRSDGLKIEAPQSRSSEEPQRIPFVPLHGLDLTTLLGCIPLVQFVQQQRAVPDKERLTSVQDFFRYTECEGRRVFQELDQDKDGRITLDDLKLAMAKMKLPSTYAKKFLHKTQSHWLAKSFGWPEFSSLIQEKEPMMIRLFNSLGVSNSGTVQRTNVKDLLRNAGLPATEDNASAMMKFLGANTEGSLKYGQFRKFMLLVPTEQLISDPWSVWFRAATAEQDSSSLSSLDLLETIFNHCTVFSKGLVHQFETAKASVVFPDVGSFEDVTNLSRIGNCFPEKQATIPLRPGADSSYLNKGIAEIPELQLFRSFKPNILGPMVESNYENEV